MTGCAQRFDRIPPILCRLLARSSHGLRLLTLRELCQRTGWGREKVIRVSRLRSWASLPIETVDRFSEACGVDLFRPSQQLKFLRRRQRVYWERATPEQRKMIARLLRDLHMAK